MQAKTQIKDRKGGSMFFIPVKLLAVCSQSGNKIKLKMVALDQKDELAFLPGKDILECICK
jgi:hypothetical protein